jgi:hypothetical protein
MLSSFNVPFLIPCGRARRIVFPRDHARRVVFPRGYARRVVCPRDHARRVVFPRDNLHVVLYMTYSHNMGWLMKTFSKDPQNNCLIVVSVWRVPNIDPVQLRPKRPPKPRPRCGIG